MSILSGSGWNSHTLGTLNSGIAALGRRSLADALGVYGGFKGLADALSAVNDGEFKAATDELEKEGVIDEDGECGPGWHLEEGPDGPMCVPDDPDWAAENPASRENKEIVAPDIHGTFSRLVTNLTDWAGITGKAVNQQPTRGGDTWFVPNYSAVRQASIDVACGCAGSLETTDGQPYVVAPYSFEKGGAYQIIEHGDVLDIPRLHLSFDREELNEQYRDLHKEDNKSTTTGGAAVLKQQIDYTAAAERAYRLRHATPIRGTLHHSIRREAHGHEVGVFQRVLMWVQDNLKASTPPGAETERFLTDLSEDEVAEILQEQEGDAVAPDYPNIVAAIDSFLDSVSPGASIDPVAARAFIQQQNMQDHVMFSDSLGDFAFIGEDLDARPYPGGEEQLLIDAQRIIDRFDSRPNGPGDRGTANQLTEGVRVGDTSHKVDGKYVAQPLRAMTLDEAKTLAKKLVYRRAGPGTPLGDLLGSFTYMEWARPGTRYTPEHGAGGELLPEDEWYEKQVWGYHGGSDAFSGGTWMPNDSHFKNPFTNPATYEPEDKGFGPTMREEQDHYYQAIAELSDPMSGLPSSLVHISLGGTYNKGSSSYEFNRARRARVAELNEQVRQDKYAAFVKVNGKYRSHQAARGLYDGATSSRDRHGRPLSTTREQIEYQDQAYLQLKKRADEIGNDVTTGWELATTALTYGVGTIKPGMDNSGYLKTSQLQHRVVMRDYREPPSGDYRDQYSGTPYVNPHAMNENWH